MYRTLKKIRMKDDIDISTSKYFDVEAPKFNRFDLLLKIHKRLNGVPSGLVISNSGFYTENSSAFLDCHLKPRAAKLKS